MGKLLYGGDLVIKSSGAKARGQVWDKNGTLKVWDFVNWYDIESIEWPPTKKES